MAANAIGVRMLIEQRRNLRNPNGQGNLNPDIIARLAKNPDGTLNLFKWDCAIPGVPGTIWEGGLYRLRLEFPLEYPTQPPRAIFTPPIPHPNVWQLTGHVCLSTLLEPDVQITQCLHGIRQLLNDPNIKSPANKEFANEFEKENEKYQARVKAFAQEYNDVDVRRKIEQERAANN